MKTSGLLGLSLGWLVASLAIAVDFGPHDTLFWPTLAIGLPALVGLVTSLRSIKTDKEPLQRGRVIGFSLVGAIIVFASVLLLVAMIFKGQPLPGETGPLPGEVELP
ncbi:MAG: hypothetical protein U0228_10885 [Myxococcaceae bacterium]